MIFRTADGASYEGRDESGNETFRVSIPSDEHGYFGRECPACQQVFRMHLEDYKALPDDLILTCPYCGHRNEHTSFVTSQQRERVMRVAKDAAMQLVSDAFGKGFGDLARSTRNNKFVKITYRSTPFYPQPLPDLDEEQLVRERTCVSCGTRYAVFGEHSFCPVSGALGATEVARDALGAELSKLSALDSIPGPQRAALREQGVFDRIAVDTLSRVVGIVEQFARAEFERRSEHAGQLLKGRGNVFQRLDDFADLYSAHLNLDPRLGPDIDWVLLTKLWAARHAHVHAGGLVDVKYLQVVKDSSLNVGQRIVVNADDARKAIRQAMILCSILAEQDASDLT